MSASNTRPLQVALAALALTASCALAWKESRSETAAALRSGAPVAALLDLSSPEAPVPATYLLVYHARSRVLEALLVSPVSALADVRLPQPLFRLEAELGAGEPAEPRAFKAWLLAALQHPRFWFRTLDLLRSLRTRSGAPGLYDGLLLAREAYGLRPEDIRLSWLPAAAARPELLARVLGGGPPPPPSPTPVVEVLNASGEPGVALQATKVLRWHGIDVLDFGNAPEVEEATHVLDRAGRPADARRAAQVLGCGDAETLTRLDPGASVPLAVVLGRDWRRCRALGKTQP